jgi:predicted secreted protein
MASEIQILRPKSLGGIVPGKAGWEYKADDSGQQYFGLTGLVGVGRKSVVFQYQ